MTPTALADQAALLLRDMPHGDETTVTLKAVVPSIQVEVSRWCPHVDAMEVLAHLTDRIDVREEADGFLSGRFDGVQVLVTWPLREAVPA